MKTLEVKTPIAIGDEVIVPVNYSPHGNMLYGHVTAIDADGFCTVWSAIVDADSETMDLSEKKFKSRRLEIAPLFKDKTAKHWQGPAVIAHSL